MILSIFSYVRLTLLFWETAIAAEMEYRLNLAIALVSACLGLGGSIFSLYLLFRTGYTFAGWTWSEALVVMGVFTLLEGFASTFLIPNLSRIVELIQQGTLDFVLLKPVSSQFWLSARTLSPWGLPNLLLGVGLLLVGGVRNWWAGIIPFAAALVSLYGIWFMLAVTSIWFTKIYNVTEVLRSLMAAGKYPMTGYPASFRFFFTFVVPVALLTTVPAEFFLDRSDPLWLAGSLGLAIALLVASHSFWRFALRFYTSASS
ncbi:MAG: ABC transporter permease [Oscillatoriales cyanobacterium SM2_2_1]|nr:ABC transporter permease [Oscillatoriales cyanobacterium SM2_2_1]